MKDPRSPQQIWMAACLAQIQCFKDWGYEIRPFVKPVDYVMDSTVNVVRQDVRVKIKKEHELPGSKGHFYKVLLTDTEGSSFIQNINEHHPDAHKFWIKNDKLEVMI